MATASGDLFFGEAMPMRILITGASGFIGSRVAGRLAAGGHLLTLLGGTRKPPVPPGGPHETHAIGGLERAATLPALLDGVEAVVHIAGRAHVFRETSASPAAAFHTANADALARLCDAMGQAGVARLVLVSSIAAKLQENDYGRSKAAGEAAAMAFASTGRTAVALRPPLVYGAGAPGNLTRLLTLIKAGIPLPFARVTNRRSLCAVENLVDAIATIVESERCGTGVFEVCDDTVVGLPYIVRALAEGLGRRAMLVPMPQALLSGTVRLVSRSMAEGLFGDLVLDNRPLRETFGIAPALATYDGLVAVGAAARS
ncbi:NAD-dependent epimerase/dehydratase family protein [Rhodopseudomonas palustris]|nr:NAD-dependent epimerase/dehydratase family protein [Rhodopseudomonas palustris]